MVEKVQEIRRENNVKRFFNNIDNTIDRYKRKNRTLLEKSQKNMVKKSRTQMKKKENQKN